MSDDLVKRLRANGLDECDEAVDRIAELEAENRRLTKEPCSALEQAILLALPGQRQHPNFGYGYFSCLDVIADDAGVDKEAARFACKRLRNKGLAIYKNGLFTEDGEPCGSGYALTELGRDAIAELKGGE